MLHINSKLYLKTTGMNSFSFPLNSAILKSSQTMKKNYGGGAPSQYLILRTGHWYYYYLYVAMTTMTLRLHACTPL